MLKEIETNKIEADKEQPRKNFSINKLATLKKSIQKYGIMQPLRVEKTAKGYILQDGERRFRVAKELKLKKVPAIVIEGKTKLDRLIQHFHIQEQHENWLPSEKAIAIYKISDEYDMSISAVCKMLEIPRTIALRMISLAKIINREKFAEEKIALDWAPSFISVVNASKKASERAEMPFNKTIQNKIEQSLIQKIKDGNIQQMADMTKIKDSIYQSPKEALNLITKNKEISAQDIFLKTKANDQYYLRRAMGNGQYFNQAAEWLAQRKPLFSAEEQQKFGYMLKRVENSCKNLRSMLD